MHKKEGWDRDDELNTFKWCKQKCFTGFFNTNLKKVYPKSKKWLTTKNKFKKIVFL